MKHFTNKSFILFAIGAILLSSCSSNLFTGKRFNLDLVKVEKQKEVKRIAENPKEIESREIIIASNENSIPQLVAPKPIYLNQENEIQTKSAPIEINAKKQSTLKSKSFEKVKSIIHPSKISKNNSTKGSGEWDWASIVGISAGVLGLFLLPIFFGLVAIVFSAIGLYRTSGRKRRGKGLAIAGLVLGIIEVLIIFLVFAVFLAAAATV